jgi:hypothetical protein
VYRDLSWFWGKAWFRPGGVLDPMGYGVKLGFGQVERLYLRGAVFSGFVLGVSYLSWFQGKAWFRPSGALYSDPAIKAVGSHRGT